MAQSIDFSLAKTSRFLSGLENLDGSQSVVSLLLQITNNRATLLAELPESSIDRILQGLDHLRQPLRKSISQARRSIGISKDPRRFLPDHCFTLLEHTDLDYSSIAQLSRPKHWSWPEVIAAQGPICAFGMGVALEQVYDPKQFRSTTCSTFEDRCRHSDCSSLILRIDLPSLGVEPPSWEGRPASRIKLSGQALLSSHLGPIDLNLWRFPGHLALEHGLRVMMSSVVSSWKSTRSSLWAWGSFVKAMFPHINHFEPDRQLLSAFASNFQNGATFSNYIGHLRSGMRWLGSPWKIDPQFLGGLLRGARKFHSKIDLPRLLQSDVEKLMIKAIEENEIPLARLMVIARHYLFRVENELMPLQIDGRGSLPHSSRAWHSSVNFFDKGAEIHLRSRKNSPDGECLSRPCICNKSPLLCGPCALRAQVDSHLLGGGRVTDRLFDISARRSISLIQSWCSVLSIERPGWHSFRRGMATDLLLSGSTISQILRAGVGDLPHFLNIFV